MHRAAQMKITMKHRESEGKQYNLNRTQSMEEPHDFYFSDSKPACAHMHRLTVVIVGYSATNIAGQLEASTVRASREMTMGWMKQRRTPLQSQITSRLTQPRIYTYVRTRRLGRPGPKTSGMAAPEELRPLYLVVHEAFEAEEYAAAMAACDKSKCMIFIILCI